MSEIRTGPSASGRRTRRAQFVLASTTVIILTPLAAGLSALQFGGFPGTVTFIHVLWMDACIATSAFWQVKNWDWFERYSSRARGNPQYGRGRLLTLPLVLAVAVGVGLVGYWMIWSDSPESRALGVSILVFQAVAMAIWCAWVIVWVKRHQREEGM